MFHLFLFSTIYISGFFTYWLYIIKEEIKKDPSIRTYDDFWESLNKKENHYDNPRSVPIVLGSFVWPISSVLIILSKSSSLVFSKAIPLALGKIVESEVKRNEDKEEKIKQREENIKMIEDISNKIREAKRIGEDVPRIKEEEDYLTREERIFINKFNEVEEEVRLMALDYVDHQFNRNKNREKERKTKYAGYIE